MSVLTVLYAILVIGLLFALPAVAVSTGRWWVVLLGVASIASVYVIFTVEPSDSFQETTTFTVVEAGLSIALFTGAIAFIYGAAAEAKPGSWWARRYPPKSRRVRVHGD
ncbi:MAG: hypothetical protein HKN80_08170 [Acidimicrobiia bacterium]|nr:hypothetical protein [Acidimicrobiia bacterium]